MSKYMRMSAGELSEAFHNLSTCKRPSSGPLRPMLAALDPYRQIAEFTGLISEFDFARTQFEKKVVRGHVGMPEWVEVTSVSAVLSIRLAMVTKRKKETTA